MRYDNPGDMQTKILPAPGQFSTYSQLLQLAKEKGIDQEQVKRAVEDTAVALGLHPETVAKSMIAAIDEVK